MPITAILSVVAAGLKALGSGFDFFCTVEGQELVREARENRAEVKAWLDAQHERLVAAKPGDLDGIKQTLKAFFS